MSLFRRGARYLGALRRVGSLQTMVRPGCSCEELTDTAFKFAGGFLKPMQVKSEIAACLMRVEALQARVVIEIGTAGGGTLMLWSRVAAEDAVIISIDLPGGQFGGGYPAWRAPIYSRLVRSSQELHLLRMDAHSRTTINKVEKVLRGRKCDFLFIDGDHTYEGVKQDFLMYSALVRNGGIIALHDIVRHHGNPDCHVDRFWSEVKSRYHCEEYVADWSQGWAGIGVLDWRL